MKTSYIEVVEKRSFFGHLFVCPFVEGRAGNAQTTGSLALRNFPCLPCLSHSVKTVRLLNRRSAKFYAPCARRRNALHGALVVHIALRLGNIGKKLQHDVRNQNPREVAGTAFPRVEKRQVFLCQVKSKFFLFYKSPYNLM